ncbi:hypothetical protein IFM47457_05268 [Aspergillus lentulus]|nr:hypothetical protein IFM47457_05268 [Aspergillus lentulus]
MQSDAMRWDEDDEGRWEMQKKHGAAGGYFGLLNEPRLSIRSILSPELSSVASRMTATVNIEPHTG